jgi:hypothetical protein
MATKPISFADDVPDIGPTGGLRVLPISPHILASIRLLVLDRKDAVSSPADDVSHSAVHLKLLGRLLRHKTTFTVDILPGRAASFTVDSLFGDDGSAGDRGGLSDSSSEWGYVSPDTVVMISGGGVCGVCLNQPDADRESEADGTFVKNLAWQVQLVLERRMKGAAGGALAGLLQSSWQHGTAILLYGASGSGKSRVVRALSRDLKVPCIVVKPGELSAMHGTRADAVLRSVYDATNQLNSCLILLDDLDLLVPRPSRQAGSPVTPVELAVRGFLSAVLGSPWRTTRIAVIATVRSPSLVSTRVLRFFSCCLAVPGPCMDRRTGLVLRALNGARADVQVRRNMLCNIVREPIHYACRATVWRPSWALSSVLPLEMNWLRPDSRSLLNGWKWNFGTEPGSEAQEPRSEK